MLRAGAIPRVLADDLHVVAAGEKHHEKYLRAIKDTRTHLRHHCGRTNRCKQELRVLDWQSDEETTCERQIRDVAARQNSICHTLPRPRRTDQHDQKVMAPTLTRRNIKARRPARRIGGIPATTKRKARLLRAKAITQATYAASISPANKRELRTAQGANVGAVCPKGFLMRCLALPARAFSDTPKKDLDLKHDHRYTCGEALQENDAR